MAKHLKMRQQLKNLQEKLNYVKFLNLIVQVYNNMEYLEVAHVVGIHLDMQILHYYSSSVIYGMDHELFLEMYLQESVLKLQNK